MYPPLNRLRMQNIFNPDINSPSEMPPNPAVGNNYTPPQLGPMNMGPMPQPMEQDYDPAARMKELYTPETAASDRFNNLIDNPPQYQPQGKLRSLAAAIIAATQGSQAGTNALMSPYNHEMATFKQKMGPAQAAATLEKGNNANERTLAYQTVNQELNNRKIDAKAKTDEANTKIREDRAAVYRYKAEHPNKKIDFSGPTVLLVDPVSGETIDTGVKTGSMSDADKLDLQHKNRTAEIQTAGGETRKTEETRQDNRKELIPIKGDEDRKTKGTTSGSLTGVKGELPTQTKARQYNTAKEFAAKNPNLAKFIKFGKSNEVSITPPSKGGFFSSAGPSEAEHKQISDAIYGTGLPISQPGRIDSTTSGQLRVKTPSGQTGTFKGTPEQAKARGYTIIQ